MGITVEIEMNRPVELVGIVSNTTISSSLKMESSDKTKGNDDLEGGEIESNYKSTEIPRRSTKKVTVTTDASYSAITATGGVSNQGSKRMTRGEEQKITMNANPGFHYVLPSKLRGFEDEVKVL